MIIDAIFAYAHFFGIGCLIAVLAMETAMLRGALGPAIFERLAKLDLGLGVSAVLILIAGAGRVGMGLKGAEYYMGNPAFWVKMGLFAAAGLASVPPTFQFIAWRKAARTNPAFQPAADALHQTLLFIKVEWLLLALIPLAAVAMVRFF